MKAIGLIAGSGQLPKLFAAAAREQGYAVHCVAHAGDADASLSAFVDSLEWVKVAQLDRIVKLLRAHGVSQAVMAGGIGRIRSISGARPDLGAFRVLASLRSMRDDEVLRGVAAYFEKRGITIVAATDFVTSVFAREGHLAGPKPTSAQYNDIELGYEVAATLGAVDVGQTVVVKDGTVFAVEAVEGTDEAVRRGGRYAGAGAVVVKRTKPGQDLRFDLPAMGPVTLEVMREVGASVLAIEAHQTVLLDAATVFTWAERLGISIVGIEPA